MNIERPINKLTRLEQKILRDAVIIYGASPYHGFGGNNVISKYHLKYEPAEVIAAMESLKTENYLNKTDNSYFLTLEAYRYALKYFWKRHLWIKAKCLIKSIP